MNRRFAAAALTIAMIAGAFGSAPRASADDSSPLPVAEPVVPSQNSPDATSESLVTKSSVDPTVRLADVKAKGAAAIAKRQTTLAEVAGRLGSQTKDCGSNAAMAAELTASATSLTSVGASLSAATDLKAAKTLYRSIFIDHRVYLVVAPKAGKVIRCDNQLLRNEALATEGAKLQVSIDEAKAKGVDTTAAQALKDAAMAQLAGINPAAALPGVIGLVPDKGDKTIQASNAAALRSSDAVLDGTYGAQKAVNAQFAAARKALANAASITRTSKKAAAVETRTTKKK